MIKACKPKNVVLWYKIMSKCVEGDSCLQKPTGIRRHRLRTLFGGGDEGNTLEQTDWTRNLVGLYGSHTLRAWVGKDTDHECFVVLFFSMRVVPRNNKRTLFRPGIQRSILRAFFCLFQSQGNSKKYANHACMNEHIFKNFFGEKPHRDGA